MQESVANVQHSSLEEQVYQKIKKAILNKDLKPGEKVSHSEWADRLNISRTPVRDALKRLENEGLIIRESERQWHVYLLTLDDVYKIFEARLAIDGYIAYLAAKNLEDVEEAALKKMLADMDTARVNRDHPALDNANNDLHRLLSRAAKNQYLSECSQELGDKLTRLWPKELKIEGRMDKRYDENLQIVQALLAHDPEAAEKAQRDHLISARNYLLLILKKVVIPYVGPEF
jgi:DNA-binding GntR family transcriptional regulator